MTAFRRPWRHDVPAARRAATWRRPCMTAERLFMSAKKRDEHRPVISVTAAGSTTRRRAYVPRFTAWFRVAVMVSVWILRSGFGPVCGVLVERAFKHPIIIPVYTALMSSFWFSGERLWAPSRRSLATPGCVYIGHIGGVVGIQGVLVY